jgi:hypothetical protein
VDAHRVTREKARQLNIAVRPLALGGHGVERELPLGFAIEERTTQRRRLAYCLQRPKLLILSDVPEPARRNR